MGQWHGRHAAEPSGFSLRKSLRRQLTKKRRSKSPLSHTFSISATAPDSVDLVNINAATEELLMTLPGVTRRMAQSIVDHRQTIGRFRRVDDLALVSGMGAERLNKIRLEICVRKPVSNSSSRTQSLDSIGSLDSTRVQVNVNTATVFQLQCVNGLNQELAANIVEYRQKKGSFKSLDDLIKVKGIDKVRLSSIKSQLAINLVPRDGCESMTNEYRLVNELLTSTERSKMTLRKSISINGIKPPVTLTNGNVNGFKANGHRKSLSVPGKCSLTALNGYSFNSVKDVYDLLSACSSRPILEEAFIYMRNNKSAVRIASWNLHEFDRNKAHNLGVREVICRTILENRLSILGIQDVLEEDALKSICDDLNVPLLQRVMEWKDNSRKWEYFLIKGSNNRKNVGFIYETSNSKLCIMANENTNISHESDAEKPLFQYGCIDFNVNDSKISILNVQLSDTNLDYCKTVLCEKVDKLLSVNKNIVIVGDFYSSEHVKDLATCYMPVIGPDDNTLVEMEDGPLRQDSGSSILIAGDDHNEYVGNSGVIRTGLCHLAIPRGWILGGPLSPYCPIWAEFYVN